MNVAENSDNIELQEVENVIYESIDTITAIQEKDLKKILQSDIRRYKRVGVGVGLLCAVLALLSIAAPLSLYQSNMVEREELLVRYNKLTKEQDDLKKWLCGQKADIKRSVCESYGFTFDDEGLCYYISTKKKTWEESRKWCRDKQSDLIVIKSKDKQDFLEREDKRVWLGLTDKDEEDSFKWVDGTPLTTPMYWNPGQPNNHPRHREQDCVEFYVNGSAARGWNDAPCYLRKNWICERALC